VDWHPGVGHKSEADEMAGWVSHFATHPVLALLIRTGAALFLAAIALTPVAIVLLWPRAGGIWVAGYVVGIATVPIVAFAVLRAVNAIFGEERLLAAFIAYGAILVIVSIASAIYAFS
jgi:ABC-type proline/glycine betaine transport system permease subunit